MDHDKAASALYRNLRGGYRTFNSPCHDTVHYLYVKFAPIYPEYNRNRMLTVTKMKSYPKDNDKSWNCSAVSYDVVKMLQDLPHLEAIGATASNYREIT